MQELTLKLPQKVQCKNDESLKGAKHEDQMIEPLLWKEV
jgi:hypothetical protein